MVEIGVQDKEVEQHWGILLVNHTHDTYFHVGYFEKQMNTQLNTKQLNATNINKSSQILYTHQITPIVKSHTTLSRKI